VISYIVGGLLLLLVIVQLLGYLGIFYVIGQGMLSGNVGYLIIGLLLIFFYIFGFHDSNQSKKRDQLLAAARARGGLTLEDVQQVAFTKPIPGARAYSKNEVDKFLALVAAALRNPPGNSLSREDVCNVAFPKPPFGKRGYNQSQVDAFLDLVQQQMPDRATGIDR
jgi:DivIVA domain-containing protein